MPSSDAHDASSGPSGPAGLPLDAFPLGITLVDGAGRLLQTNAEASRLLGLSRAELELRTLQSPLWTLFHADGAPMAAEDLPGLRALREGRRAVEPELGVRRPDGTTVWLSVTAEPLEPGRVLITFSDVSDHHRSKAVLAEAMQAQEILQKQDQAFREVNSFLATCGSAPGEDFFQSLARFLAGKLGMDFVCIDQLEGDGLTAQTLTVWHDGRFEDNVAYALKDTPCGSVVGETVSCFPAGVAGFFPGDAMLQDLRAESYAGVTLWDHRGRPAGLIAVIGRRPMADPALTESVLKLVAGRAAGELERRQAEATLKEGEEQLRVIFETSEAGIILVASDGRITFANRRMAEMFGTSLQELIGSPYTNHLHPSEKQAGDERMRQLIQGQIPSVSVERHYLRRDGSAFWGHLSGRRLEHPDGNLNALVGVITDITERKRMEREQLLVEQKIQQAQKMESLGSLAGGVAHDMNNVLGAILGLASAHLENHPAGSPTHRAFDTIFKAAQRGGEMVKSLLNLARQNPAEQRELDLNAILREEVHLLERTTLAKVRLQLDLAPDLRPIQGDAADLAHAFMNLCVNAVDAMPENGTLTLGTRNLEGGWVEARVEDTGMGMAPEVLEKALDPFFTTKEVGKGTGLGLSLVYTTVKAHGGKMELQSEPGRGTRVILSFPASGVSGEPRESSGPQKIVGGLPSLKVLLVDDDELIQSSMQAVLELLGHRVTLAPSGEEALAKLEAGLRPALVILDMNMPGLGGAGTLPRLRALLPEVPVLLATGRADQTARDLAQAHAGVTLLAKPFSMGDLQQHLEPFTRL